MLDLLLVGITLGYFALNVACALGFERIRSRKR